MLIHLIYCKAVNEHLECAAPWPLARRTVGRIAKLMYAREAIMYAARNPAAACEVSKPWPSNIQQAKRVKG